MGGLLCREKERPWIYGVATPTDPPTTGPLQLVLISPASPPQPSRMDSVDPIRSAITRMGGWGEPVTPPAPVKHVSTSIP